MDNKRENIIKYSLYSLMILFLISFVIFIIGYFYNFKIAKNDVSGISQKISINNLLYSNSNIEIRNFISPITDSTYNNLFTLQRDSKFFINNEYINVHLIYVFATISVAGFSIIMICISITILAILVTSIKNLISKYDNKGK